MKQCLHDTHTKCVDPGDCLKCPTFKKSGQATLDATIRNQKSIVQPPVTTTTTTATSTTRIEGIDINQKVLCAYCLHQDPLAKFLITTKKGYHRSQAKCPVCTNGQLIKTLTAEMTPEQYADFAYENIGYGFWQKVPFYEWRRSLEKLGWAQRFWLRYKERKGAETTETLEQYLQRKQREEWNEQEGYE